MRSGLKIVMVGMLAGCLWGCDSEFESSEPRDAGISGARDAGLPEVPLDVTDGGALYAAYCASCHGLDGSGTEQAPTILNPVRGYATYVVRAGRGDMGYRAPMAKISEVELSAPQLDLVIDWLRQAPKPREPLALYLRFCGNCHGIDASGGRSDKDIRGEDFDEVEETIRKGHGRTRYAEADEYMPAWPADELTQEEVQAIASWLALQKEDDDDDK